jgi:hypothetical protein
MARGRTLRLLLLVSTVLLVALQTLGLRPPEGSDPASTVPVAADRTHTLAAGRLEPQPTGSAGETVTLREGRGHDTEPSRLRGRDRLRSAPAPELPHPVPVALTRGHCAKPSAPERATPASVSRAPRTPSLASLQMLRC